MSDEWSDEHMEMLLKVVTLSGWYVSAENLPIAGDLVRAGLIDANDDYEGPQLSRNDKGVNFLRARGLIAPCSDQYRFSPWDRTTASPFVSQSTGTSTANQD